MAREKKESKRAKAGPGTTDGMPEGFVRVNPESGQLAWFKAAEGSEVTGEMLGRFQRPPQRGRPEQHYYQLRVTVPCKGMREQQLIDLDPGELINVDERWGLRDLRPIAEDRLNRHVVFIRATEQVKLPAGNTVWRFDVGDRIIGQRAGSQADADAAGAGADDAPPF